MIFAKNNSSHLRHAVRQNWNQGVYNTPSWLLMRRSRVEKLLRQTPRVITPIFPSFGYNEITHPILAFLLPHCSRKWNHADKLLRDGVIRDRFFSCHLDRDGSRYKYFERRKATIQTQKRFVPGWIELGLTLKAEKLARFRLGEPTVVQNGRRGERRSRVAGIREGHLRIGQSWIQTCSNRRIKMSFLKRIKNFFPLEKVEIVLTNRELPTNFLRGINK